MEGKGSGVPMGGRGGGGGGGMRACIVAGYVGPF